MKYLFLIAGVPGSGKTTFAEYLQNELKIPMIGKDKMKELLFDTVGFKSFQEKENLDLGSTEILYYIARQHMKVDLPLILENNFLGSEAEAIEKMIGEYHYKAITVLFDGDMAVIHKRLCERDFDPSRHPAHANNTIYPVPEGVTVPVLPLMTQEQFEKMMGEWGVRDFHVGEVIRVDTSDFSKVSYPDILKKIKDLINA